MADDCVPYVSDELAREEQIDLLTQDIKAWNAWRHEHPETVPDLRRAEFVRADLELADLSKANLRGAILRGAKLTKADLWQADLRGTDVSFSDLSEADVLGVQYEKRTKCHGADLTGCRGNAMFLRFAQDQDWIASFRATKRGMILYWPWWLFMDCGRSFGRWLFWSVLAAIAFALVFFYGLGEGAFDVANLPWSFGTMAYYSVVTFTTLGFGDITPKTPAAAYWVMAEVVAI